MPTAEGDHAKYAVEYAKFGVDVYGPEDIMEKKQFPFGKFHPLLAEKTKKIGSFSVVPFANFHDVPIFGYIIHHKEMGNLLFSTDSYKIEIAFGGIDHYLIEANYADPILKENVWDGKLDKQQADRIMLSHMSLDYCIKYLRDSGVGGTESKTKTITLCHLSERNSYPDQFKNAVAGTFGIPTFVATKGLVVELNKDII